MFDSLPQNRGRELVFVAALCILLTAALAVRTHMLDENYSWWSAPYDHHKYLYMAEHPVGSFHIQPFCWRIGNPFLAGRLPFSTLRNFQILTLTFLAATGVLLYYWLRLIPFRPAESILGVLLFFSYGAATKLLMIGSTSPDPASYFLVMIALYSIYSFRDLPFALALAAGALVKETVLIVAPLYYTLRAKHWWEPRLALRAIILALPAAAILIFIRITVPDLNADQSYTNSLPYTLTQVSAGDIRYDLKTAFLGNMRVYGQETAVNLLRTFTWGSMGLLMFLPLFDPRRNAWILLRSFPYWGMIAAALLIALNPDRRIAACFPFLILMGLNGLRELASLFRAPVEWFAPVFLVQIALNLLKPEVSTVPFDLAAAVFLISLSVVVALARRRESS